MDVIYFNECNIEAAKNQPEYLNLPAHMDDDGIVTSCWKMTWKERFKVLFLGCVYSQLMTFGKGIQPQKIVVDKPLMD